MFTDAKGGGFVVDRVREGRSKINISAWGCEPDPDDMVLSYRASMADDYKSDSDDESSDESSDESE